MARLKKTEVYKHELAHLVAIRHALVVAKENGIERLY
jgi:hypothetical protein